MTLLDALLVIQASNCNAKIPAKIYGYLWAYKPILGLTGPDGGTAGVTRGAGLIDIARLDLADELGGVLPLLVSHWQRGKSVLPPALVLQQSSWRGRCEALAELLNRTLTI